MGTYLAKASQVEISLFPESLQTGAILKIYFVSYIRARYPFVDPLWTFCYIFTCWNFKEPDTFYLKECLAVLISVPDIGAKAILIL